MAETMLNVEGVNVYYGAIHAIKDISFHVNEGGDRHPDRRQRRRQIHQPEDHLGPAAPQDRHHHL